MTKVDPNLVREIAEQVMAALRAGRTPLPQGSAPVAVHAPIGQCTGDYSKFEELRGNVGAVGPVEKTVDKGASEHRRDADATFTALTGVITVQQLKAVRGTVRLAKGAMLSPLAADYVRERRLSVMVDEGAAVVHVNAGAAHRRDADATQVLWWIDGQCASVAKVVEELRPGLLASRERGSAENLKSVVKELAALVKGKRVSGGILFVPSAARAVCYANRCASLRAVVATNERAVSEGIELLGANVLVVEYPAFGAQAMLGMVRGFLERVGGAPANVQRELEELRNC